MLMFYLKCKERNVLLFSDIYWILAKITTSICYSFSLIWNRDKSLGKGFEHSEPLNFCKLEQGRHSFLNNIWDYFLSIK